MFFEKNQFLRIAPIFFWLLAWRVELAKYYIYKFYIILLTTTQFFPYFQNSQWFPNNFQKSDDFKTVSIIIMQKQEYS